MEGSLLSTIAEWNMGEDWSMEDRPADLSVPEHYTEEQRRVVEGPMFDLLRALSTSLPSCLSPRPPPTANSSHPGRLAISEMTSYAADHALIDFMDPVPPSVYALRWYHKLIRYPRLRLQEAMGSNPYRVPWYVYVLCTGMLVMCLVIKAVVIDRYARMPVACSGVRWGLRGGRGGRGFVCEFFVGNWWRRGRANVDSDQVRVWDTLAGVLPIVVTFVLFLFPPLLAKP